MNLVNKITSTTLKATLLSTVLFWGFTGILEGPTIEAMPFVFISIIPISIICFMSILLSIAPFYSLYYDKMEVQNIFKRYFPYYAIILFLICVYFIIESSFDKIALGFFSTAFFTGIQSWIWFFKTSTK